MAETLDSAARATRTELSFLVARAQRGDELAFGSLHARFVKSVHAILLARLSSPDADDGVQETFLQAWKRLETLRDPSTVGAWLHTIARNVATNRRRAMSAREEPLLDSAARVESRSGDSGETCELRERVMQHLRSLPEAYRETLAMRLVEGMTGPEISEATGLTPGSVRVNLCRGMELLRELLEKEGWP